MPWQYFDASDDTYMVNWTGVTQIFRTYLHSRGVWENSTTKVEKKLLGPDLHTVEVDWGKVRAYKDTEVEQKLQAFYVTAKQQGMRDAFEHLKLAIAEGHEYDRKYLARVKTASTQTMKNIGQSVERGETALTVATAVRDLSAETLVVGATFLSGGAALGVLGAGATLKGTGKWQDTGSWKAGAVEVGVNMTIGVIGLKVGASQAMTSGEKLLAQIVLSKAQGLADAPKALVEGSTLQQGIASGALKMGAAPWQELGKDKLTLALKGTKWELLAIPAQVIINYGIDKAGGAAADAAKPGGAPAPPKPAPKQADAAYVDPATFSKDFIKKCAIQPVRSATWLDA